MSRNDFRTIPMGFRKKNFFFEKQTNEQTNKQAKWCGHLDFWGIFLASECPELYKNVYMSLGQIYSLHSQFCRTL